MAHTNATAKRNGKEVKVYVPSNDTDALQPKFIFSMTATELLCAIVNGQIDAKELAQKELQNRGLNNDGIWVGFRK